MISHHDKTKQNEGFAAANQPAQSKAKRPAVQAKQAQVAGGNEHAGQMKTYQAMADEHAFSTQAVQLLKAKGKVAGLAAAAERCGFDPGDDLLIKCWNDAASLAEFERLTANAEAFGEYERSQGPAAAAPVVVPVFVEPDEAGQRAQFALEAAEVEWKAGHPLAPANFSGVEIRDALPDIVKVLKNTFHNANGIGTLLIRQEKNAARARLDALFEVAKQRLLAREAEGLRDAAFVAGKQILLALPAVQGNAIVLDVVTRLQRSGNMVTAVVPGTHTQGAIGTAITVWLSLIPQLPAVITNLNVPGGRVIKPKLRGVQGGGQAFDYNKNLICHVDNNPNNFHVNADPALVAAINAAHNKEVAL